MLPRFACCWWFALCCGAASAQEASLDRYLAPLPKGAKARLGMRIDTANNVTYAAPAQSPDGRLLASVIDHNVLIWDTDGRVSNDRRSPPKGVTVASTPPAQSSTAAISCSLRG